MTSEKLYGILKFLDVLDKKLGLQKSLEQIGTALANLVNSPAAPQHQSSLASALQSFGSAVGQMKTAITPSQMVAIKAIGGGEFFDPSIFEKVKETVQMNAMTPTVARDFVQELVTRRAQFLATIWKAREALEELRLKDGGMEPGSADVAFLIPRDIFDNEVGPFAKELGFIDRLIGHYSEAIMGEVQPAKLEELSSSVPTVALLAALPVLDVLGTVVNKFLDAWEKIEKIRKMRLELTEMGLKGVAQQLTEQIKTTVDQVVEESTELVLRRHEGDGGRKSELRTAVEQDTRRLFGQIERGSTVEFRVKQDGKDEDDEKHKMLENIENVSSQMKFPPVAKEPMLLKGEQILEGDIEVLRYTKKTTTRTTSSKKGPAKDAVAAEAKR